MSTSSHPQQYQPELLTSWKEIASYLGKGVRTVQRWEQHFELPVRRPNEKAKGIVYATRQELDTWLESQWTRRPKESGMMPSADCAEIRERLRESTELRHANRQLLADVKSCVASMIQECEIMARNLNSPSPGENRRISGNSEDC
jgi:hypothetical protein